MSVEAILKELKNEKQQMSNNSKYSGIWSDHTYDEYDRGYLRCLNRVIGMLEKEPPTSKEGLFMENLSEAITKGVAEALRNESYRKKREEEDAKWADSLTPNDCH